LFFKKKTTWVVVADGARSSVYVNNGRGTGLRILSETKSAGGRRPTRELGTGKPGRGFAPGDARHAFDDPEDWHQQEKRMFARDVAREINKAAEQKAFDRLVIAAPAKIMGELRDALNHRAREKLKAELTKDLTNTPAPELPGHFKDVVPL
jgi:protein required for attachment to host cells